MAVPELSPTSKDRKEVKHSPQPSAERIAAATLQLLSQRCLHSVSIRDIADAAQVNSALIAYHFENKENLYRSVLTSLFNLYEQQVLATLKTDGDFSANIRAACSTIAQFHQQYPSWLTLYFREITNPSPVYYEVIQPCIKRASDRFVAMIEAGMAAGTVAPETNPRFVTLALVGMVNYFFMTRQLMHDLQLEPANNSAEYLEFTCSTLLSALTPR